MTFGTPKNGLETPMVASVNIIAALSFQITVFNSVENYFIPPKEIFCLIAHPIQLSTMSCKR